eukprot:9476348-Pyramimonas_sp.AAC.2
MTVVGVGFSSLQGYHERAGGYRDVARAAARVGYASTRIRAKATPHCGEGSPSRALRQREVRSSLRGDSEGRPR